MNKLLQISYLITLLGIVAFFNACGSKKVPDASKANVNESRVLYEQFSTYFIDATTHFNNNNFETSLRMFLKCLEFNPNEAAVHYYISRIYQHQKLSPKALTFAAQAADLAPQNLYFSVWYAQLLRKNYEPDLAISVLQKVYPFHKKDEVLASVMDSVFLNRDKVQDAILVWQNMIENKGFQLKFAHRLIQLYMFTNQFNEVHKIYDEIKKAAPLKYQYYIDDGNLYLNEKKESEAMLNFEKALKISPENYELNVALFKFNFKNKNYNEAKKYLIQAFNDFNTSFETKSMFCSELKVNSITDSNYNPFLIIVSDKISKYYLKNANAHHTAANLYEQSNQLNKAYESFLKTVALDPNRYDAWIGAIRTSSFFQNSDSLLKTTQLALEYFPFSSGIYTNSCTHFVQYNDWKHVNEFSKKGQNYAIDDSTKIEFYTLIGLSELKLKNYQNSINELNKGISIHKNNQNLYELLGDAYALNNNLELALINWNQSKSLGNNSTLLLKKINEKKYFEQ